MSYMSEGGHSNLAQQVFTQQAQLGRSSQLSRLSELGKQDWGMIQDVPAGLGVTLGIIV